MTEYKGRGGWRGGGRPKTETPAKRRSVRLSDKDYNNFKELGGADWLRNAIDDALTPIPTELDNFKNYAVKNAVHLGEQTMLKLFSLYHDLKYDYGWTNIIKIFKKRSQIISYRQYELEMSDEPCKWCGKWCSGSCDEAKKYIYDVKNIF